MKFSVTNFALVPKQSFLLLWRFLQFRASQKQQIVIYAIEYLYFCSLRVLQRPKLYILPEQIFKILSCILYKNDIYCADGLTDGFKRLLVFSNNYFKIDVLTTRNY